MSEGPDLRINARFVVERELGRGGIGVVYLAKDREAGDAPVVVKVLLEQTDPKVRAWIEDHFRKEAEALSRIKHPGVVKLVAAGETDDGKPYFAMEFVEAKDLRSQIDSTSGLSGGFERVAQLVRELGSALSAAHDMGIYHRDLKPENILVTIAENGDDEHVKVIDFGIATVKNSLDEKTRATVLAGSIDYMAPEQLQGRPSATSDIFALGVISYEMLTGRRPFTPDRKEPVAAMLQLLELQRGGVRVRPKDLRPSLPEAAQTIVLRALAFAPAERFRRADEFGNALAAALTATVVEELPEPTDQLEMAYVLFCDIVGYSKLPMDLQAIYLRELQSLIQGLSHYREAQGRGEVVSLPTGDGMAMAFFGLPLRAVQSAVDLARQLGQRPHIRLRMGINAGMVYQVADINANRNVAGGGINMAQRVMDFGDAGHILVSQSVAEMLTGLSGWADNVTDLGVHPAKHGVPVHVYNLVGPDFGSATIPEKLRPKTDEDVEQDEVRRRHRSAATRPLAVAVAVAVATLGLWALYKQFAGHGGITIPGPVVIAPDERSLMYWATLQQYKGRTRVGGPIKMTGGVSGEMYFLPDDALTFYVTPSAEGHLYMFSEELPTGAGASTLNILFPTEERNRNSSAVRAGAETSTDELVFDSTAGTERIWLAWSAAPIERLETAVMQWSNRKAQGEITDPAVREEILKYLGENAGDGAKLEPAPAGDAMVVRKAAGVIVVPLTLAHRSQ